MAIYFDDIQGDVASIFLSYFQRAPEFEAMQHYVGVLQALQANPETAGNAFNLLAAHIYADGVASQEVPAGPTVTDTWYVNYLYSNVLGRAPDAEGLAYWVAELAAGNIARAELVGTFVAAALESEGRDAAYLNNRTEVAVEFAQWENSNPQVLPTLKYNAAEVLLGVNEDPATVAEAQTKLNDYTGQIGQTFNLTPGIDTVEGTSLNDTINAFSENPATGAEQTTLNPFDTIDGGEGFDTLNIYTAWGINQVQQGTVRNVEVVNVFSGDGATLLTADARAYEGVQQFWQIGNANDVVGAGNTTAVGFRDITLEAGWETFQLTGNASTAGSGILNAVRTVWIDDTEFRGTGLNGNAAMNELVSVINAAGIGVQAVRTNDGAGLELTSWQGIEFEAEGAAEFDVVLDPVDVLAESLDVSFTGTTGTIALDNFETESGEADATLNVMGAALTTVNIVGNIAADSDLNLTVEVGRNVQTVSLNTAVDTVLWAVDNAPTSTNNVTAVDASGSTGDVVYFVDASVKTVTGGAGNDVIIFSKPGATLDLFSAIDGGEGDDIVVLSNRTFQTQTYDAINQMTSIESLGFIGEDVVLDAAQVSDYKSLIFGSLDGYGYQDVTIRNLASDQVVTIADDDHVDVELLNAAANVSFVVEDDALLHLWLGRWVDDAWANVGATGGTLSLSGEGDVGFGNWAGKFSVIDASELEGSLDLWGMKSGWVETVLLGSGSDIVELEINDGTSSSSTKGHMDIVENFNSVTTGGRNDVFELRGDSIKLTDGAAVRVNVATASNLNQAFQLAADAYADATLVYFQFGGDTYLYADTVSTGGFDQYDDGDFALKVVGEHNFAQAALFDGPVM